MCSVNLTIIGSSSGPEMRETGPNDRRRLLEVLSWMDPNGWDGTPVYTNIWTTSLMRSSNVQGRAACWLEPFRNHQSSCPYLVGREDELQVEMRRFMRQKVSTSLVDSMETEETAAVARHLREAASSLRDETGAGEGGTR